MPTRVTYGDSLVKYNGILVTGVTSFDINQIVNERPIRSFGRHDPTIYNDLPETHTASINWIGNQDGLERHLFGVNNQTGFLNNFATTVRIIDIIDALELTNAYLSSYSIQGSVDDPLLECSASFDGDSVIYGFLAGEEITTELGSEITTEAPDLFPLLTEAGAVETLVEGGDNLTNTTRNFFTTNNIKIYNEGTYTVGYNTSQCIQSFNLNINFNRKPIIKIAATVPTIRIIQLPTEVNLDLEITKNSSFELEQLDYLPSTGNFLITLDENENYKIGVSGMTLINFNQNTNLDNNVTQNYSYKGYLQSGSPVFYAP